MPFNYPPAIPSTSTTAPAAITVGASPYTYQNTTSGVQGIVISGGTVTTIEYSKDNSIFYLVGLLAGVVELSPSHYLKVTYAVAPTMTKVFR